MEYIKKNYVVVILVAISCLLLGVAIFLLVNGNYFKLSNESNKNDTNSSLNQDTNLEVDDKDEVISNTDTDVEDSTTNNTGGNTNTNSNTDTETYSEEDVISYFRTTDNSINSSVNQDDQTLQAKIKNGFVGIIDFIFYDKEIRGYTFSELTNSAKLQVIKIALTIDNKIDQYFPNYKDKIKDTYTDIKGKLAVKYLELTASLCDSVGEDTCNQAKEDFNTMKSSFGFTWDLIKELASSGASKLQDFYESWRDK